MEKIIHCRDAGFNCDGVIRGKSENEVLALAADHAKSVHSVQDVTPEMVEKIRSVIRTVEDAA